MKEKFRNKNVQVLTFALFMALVACGGGGGGNDNSGSPDASSAPDVNSPGSMAPPGPVGTIQGVVSGTVILALDEDGRVVATDSTSGRSPDVDLNEDGIKESFSFRLEGIPVGRNIRIFLIEEGDIYPMFFDTDGDGVPDNNVFALRDRVDLDLGLIGFYSDTRVVPANNPSLSERIALGSPDVNIPLSISRPPTQGMSLGDLIEAGMDAFNSGWFSGAKHYFQNARSLLGGNGVSRQQADTVLFMHALSTLAAIPYDVQSDGDPQDLTRPGDFLDLIGIPNDDARGNFERLSFEFHLFSHGGHGEVINNKQLPSNLPTSASLQDYLYGGVAQELKNALEALKAVSEDVRVELADPMRAGPGRVEIDSGDVMAMRAVIQMALAAISSQRAYNLDLDVDALFNGTTTVEQIVRDNSSLLSIEAKNKLNEARTWALAGLDDLEEAVDIILSETDPQGNDLITIASASSFLPPWMSSDPDMYRIGLKEADDYWERRIKSDIEMYRQSIVSGVPAPGNTTNRIDWKRFFDGNLDFRSPSNLLPQISGNYASGYFPDPTLAGVIPRGDLNEDRDGNGIPDILE